MRIVLAGGTGFIGREVIRTLDARGCEVSLLTRHPSRVGLAAFKNVREVPWDGLTLDEWVKELDGADAVINLAGEPLSAKRWSYPQKYRIMMSRVDATRSLVYAIQHTKKKPAVLINASGVGYYGHVDHEVSESAKPGTDFLAHVCEKWEEAALKVEKSGVRLVMLRLGIVLGKDGGVLQRMLPPFRLFLGGWPGSGRQWFPWIHRDDVVNIIMHALENTTLRGPVNLVAKEAVTMKQMCVALGRALHRPCWTFVPTVVLRLVLGEMSEMLTTGQRPSPAKLLQSGYALRYPRLKDALSEIFS